MLSGCYSERVEVPLRKSVWLGLVLGFEIAHGDTGYGRLNDDGAEDGSQGRSASFTLATAAVVHESVEFFIDFFVGVVLVRGNGRLNFGNTLMRLH